MTENHIRAAGRWDPEAPDEQVAEVSPRGQAAEEPRAAGPHARPLSQALGNPPLCAHGMNPLADRGYDLGLARLRRG